MANAIMATRLHAARPRVASSTRPIPPPSPLLDSSPLQLNQPKLPTPVLWTTYCPPATTEFPLPHPEGSIGMPSPPSSPPSPSSPTRPRPLRALEHSRRVARHLPGNCQGCTGDLVICQCFTRVSLGAHQSRHHSTKSACRIGRH